MHISFLFKTCPHKHVLFTMHYASIPVHARLLSAGLAGTAATHRRLSTKTSPVRTPLLLSRAANRAQAAIARAAGNTSSGNPGHPDSAAAIIWGLPPTARPCVHVALGEQLRVTNIVPLRLDDLHPDLLTNSTLTQFLSQNLLSKGAKREGTKALVLSTPYLPSQLSTMETLAYKQQLQALVYISNDNSTLHAVFLHQPADDTQPNFKALQAALAATLGPLQPMPSSRLQVASLAEQSLRQQLRLWDAATWSSVLQQQLESASSYTYVLAVRSLMGPPALEAAQKLVLKKGLFWLEVQDDDIKALAGSNTATNSSGSSSGTRRRIKRGSTAAATTAEPISGAGEGEEEQGLPTGRVIIISRREWSVEDAADISAECFTDFVVSTKPAVADGAPAQPPGLNVKWPNIFGM